MPPTLANLIWVMPAEGSELRLCYQLYAATGIALAVFLLARPEYIRRLTNGVWENSPQRALSAPGGENIRLGFSAVN